MHFSTIVTSTLLLLAEANVISAKAILHMPSTLRRRHLLEDMHKNADRILRREQQSTPPMPVSSANNTTNQTISTACVDALSKHTSVENSAGLAACYNIMQFDAQQGLFEADLRLYQMFEPSGGFQGVPVTDIMIGVTYPSSTMFQSVTKRKKRDIVVERQSSTMTEVQQYTLFGTFQKNLDMSKLNDTQIMSLMLPDVKLNAVNFSQTPITANVTAADGAWFVVGHFTGEFKDTLVSPTVATAAITAAAPFVLPGVTLGIFPTGLIVTCAWTLLFFLAYGFGTLGRIRYRDAYRKRKAAQAGRTGKRI